MIPIPLTQLKYSVEKTFKSVDLILQLRDVSKMIGIYLRSMYAADFFDYLEFSFELGTFILILALSVIIYYSMKRNEVFKRGAGPWIFVASILLLVPLFFDVIQDFARLFAPNLVQYGFDDLIDDIDVGFFILGAILGAFGFYRQYLHTETLDAQLKSQVEYGEQSVKELAELLPQTVFELDTTGKITYANQAGLDTFGYSAEEIKRGVNVSLLFVPEDLKRVRKNIGKIMKGEPFEDHEYIALHRNRKRFPVLIYSSPVIREQKPVGIRGVIIDITERKEIENAIRESEKRYRKLVKQAPTGIYESELNFKTGDAKVLYANDLLLELFEITEEEALSLNLYEMLAEGSKELWLSRAAKIIANEEISDTIEYEILTKSGKKLWLLLRSNMEFIEGKSVRATVAVHDITEIKLSEKEVRESEVRFKSIFENVNDGIILADPEDGRIFLANQSFCEMFGYTEQEIHNLSLSDIRPEQKYNGLKVDAKKIEDKVLSFASEIPLRKKDGSIFHVDINITPIVLEDNKYHIGIFRNVEERTEAEKIRKELQNRRDNFIRMVNHELRTPLTVLYGYNELLQNKLDSMNDQQKVEVYSIISKNLNRLERLISDNQAITQLERGQFQIKRQTINFKAFMEKILTPYLNVLDDQFEFIFDKSTEGKNIEYSLDGDRIQQVFDNVIDNAIKNSSKGKRIIKVEIKDLDECLEVNIIDNGAGIDPKDLDRIFNQFVTIETEYSIQGTGIGLYLSREIMKAHGGTIIASSEGKGRGTTITLTFPKE